MNRKPTLQPHPLTKALRLSRSWWAAPAAFLATLLALPVTAGVTIPDDPLTTGTRVAPNILFILDDSGSMEDTFMPDSVPATSAPDVSMAAYTRNTLSYNPAVSYQTWTLANGNRRTGGTSYTSAYDHLSLASGSIDLASNIQTFYVPKDVNNNAAAYVGDGTNYYRYQILTNGEIYRAEYLAYTAANTPTTGGTLGSSGSVTAGNYSTTWNFVVPAGAGNLVISSAGGTPTSGLRGADLFIRRDNATVNTSSYDWRQRNNGNAESQTISSPVAGTYYVRLYAQTAFTGPVTVSYSYIDGSKGCAVTTSGNAWRNCTRVTPTGRTEANERTNFATWYSYHRTRMKAAKAGASDAFKPLGNRVRVGYRSIWDRSNFDIPVGDGNDGRFVDNPDDPGTPANEATTSRSTWYSRLHAADGSGRTPLKPALTAAGQYFGNTTATGPYGPQATASQYSCRQNFTILTTDGYWNEGTTSVGNADNSNGTTYTDPEGDTYGYTAAAPYRDSYSNTLADVAMHYWKTDLRTLTNNVPTSAGDPAFWQHMVTFGISIGLSGNKGWSSVGDVPANATWADPNDTEDADRIDDLLHAAVNGHGTFVSASSPSEFTAGLSQALAAIQQRTSSYSNVATNSVSLDAGSQVFNASYVSGIWTGKVTARAVSKTGVSDTTREFTIPAWGSRNVFTSNGLAGASFPTSTQEAALLRTGGPVDYPVTGAQNANYLKGDGSLEERNSGLLRNRPTTVLGDIVGSSPAYVKDTDTLYVGANDGMLHAFNATSGTELFAYVPGIINFNHLSTLSRGDYSHKFFVDGPIVVSNRNQTPSENILVGALGKGGKGVYSLNVGNPASATASSAFNWERSDTVGGHMGLVLGKPILGRVPAGQTAVILGNGVNSTSEKAVLIVLNLDTGAVIQQIDTGVGSAAAPNGLSAPVGVYDQDGKTIRYVYAGDMRGNVWKFDLNGAGSATRLFTAVGPSSNVQPISGGLAVAIHPVTKKRWVFFGTGRFLTTSDAETAGATTQSMYGFEDTGTTLTRSDLEARGAPVVSGNVRTFQAKATLPTGRKGWYIDLTTSGGERIVQDAQVVNTFLITASMVPTGDACEADGTGYINALDAFTGTSAGGSYFDQNRNGDTSDDKVGGVPIGSINAGVGMPTLPNLLRGMLIVGGTAGDDLGDPSTLGVRWDRVSWREIRQD
jgi:type IV pilus assembly protein PilY1